MSALRFSLAMVLGVVMAGCASDDNQAASDSAAGAADAPATYERAGAVEAAFQTPEAVRFDEGSDLYYVSNINGGPSAKDNNGFISRVHADGGHVDSLKFIAGGRGGVTLHAPKGLAIAGDTLWVTDIDAVRAFNKTTGAHIVSHAVRDAVFLNDIVVGPDGALYITDTGIRFDDSGMSHPGPDRVFKVTRDGQVSTALQLDGQPGPNGIAWDSANERFIIAGFAGKDIMAWKPGEAAATTVATGVGQFDGVERLADGRILVSTWTDSSIYVLDGSALVRVISGVESPADIGVDTKRNRVAVPLFQGNRVELYSIPAKAGM